MPLHQYLTNELARRRILNIAISSAVIGIWVFIQITGQSHRTDFTTLHRAWRMMWTNDRQRMYDLASHQELHAAIMREEGKAFDFIMPFAPPAFALLPLAPLGLLPRPLAYTTWGILQLALAAAFLLSLSPLTRAWSAPARQIGLGAFLLSPSLTASLVNGNLSLFPALAASLFACAPFRRSAVAAGLAATLAMAKPQCIYGLLLFWLGARSWTSLAATGVTAPLLAAAATACFSPAVWMGNIHGILATGGESMRSLFPSSMVNLRAILMACSGGDWLARHPAAMILSGFLGACVAFGFGCLARRRENPLARLCCLSTALIGAMFFSPHLNVHDAILLALPAVVVVNAHRQWPFPNLPRIALACLLGTMLLAWGFVRAGGHLVGAEILLPGAVALGCLSASRALWPKSPLATQTPA